MSTKKRLALGLNVVGAISLFSAIITSARGDARGALTATRVSTAEHA
ncbi:MAG: hypothetical protein ABR499_07930 [Gemmatimonadaceae bacterium]